ncbi:hypothetical protein CJ030_MR5G017113 [Morella rubra]|uniref:Uncharacterized protein n=1 Tax=Morella rubra TaxID=262757 RepID=A0A6A1VT59_9ROSI|nr:hypothetical protein CJ030_MR5G017113 [Morella rubra]
MTGIEKSSTMTFMASMGEHNITVLVDSGSTHNFINTHLVTKAGLHEEEIEAFEVKLANGGRMRCEEIVKVASIDVEGMHVVVDLYVFSLDELDVVLGDPWLKGIGKIMFDYGGRSMEFTLGGRMVTWSMGGPPREKITWEDYNGMASRVSKVTLGVKGTFKGRGIERVLSDDMGRDSMYGRIGAKMRRHWHPWAPLTRPPRAQQEHHSHAMASARARKHSALQPDKAWRLSNTHAWHASQPATDML